MSPANPKYFVDTNILIYAHDRAAGPKHERARQLIEHLWTTGQGALSTQVLQDLCVNLRRKVAHPLASAEVRKLIEDYLSWEVVVNTPQSILAALEIEARHKVSYWDALILQAAESCGAAVLYSQDLASGQRYGAVEVVNPLASSIKAFDRAFGTITGIRNLYGAARGCTLSEGSGSAS